ncbi:carbohydrate kinase family protein [Candidatus Woesearchaeota archaeon]|nr:carbohydrate kinase family protein [Candidatus Woesearchaeota archaeon]
MRGFDIVCVGSATSDVFCDTNCEVVNIKKKGVSEEVLAYPVGSKILINDISFEIGGGGTNTAVAASRLGLRAAYLGNIGEDDNGKKVLSLLRKEKVSFVGTKTDDMTNMSVVLDSVEDDRTILVYKGASNKLRFDKVNKTRLKAKWFYLCAMVGDAYVELEKIALFAKSKGSKIAFNPSSYLALKGGEYLKKVLKITDFLILNKEEAELLVGKNESCEALARKLSIIGPTNVAITEGKKPITVLYQGKIDVFKPNLIKSKETTGAGDAFGSTLISSLILNKDIEASVKAAISNSENVIQSLGAKNGLLTRKDLF